MIHNFINLVSFWQVTDFGNTRNKWYVDSVSLWLLILLINKSTNHKRFSGVKMFDILMKKRNSKTGFLLAHQTEYLKEHYYVLPLLTEKALQEESKTIIDFCRQYDTIIIGISSPKQDKLALFLQEKLPHLEIYCLGAAVYNKTNKLIDSIGLNFLLFGLRKPKRFVYKMSHTIRGMCRVFKNKIEFKKRIKCFYDVY